MDEEVKSTSWSRPPVREIALMMAIDFANASEDLYTDKDVVLAAERFRAFLTLDDVSAPVVQAGGITVNVTGMKLTDADVNAITNEVQWILRSHDQRSAG